MELTSNARNALQAFRDKDKEALESFFDECETWELVEFAFGAEQEGIDVDEVLKFVGREVDEVEDSIIEMVGLLNMVGADKTKGYEQILYETNSLGKMLRLGASCGKVSDFKKIMEFVKGR